MKSACFVFGIVLLLAGCNPERREATRGLRIVTVTENGVHRFILRNDTAEPATVSENFAFAGVGGGNVFLLAMNDQDKLSAPCQVLDSPPYDMTRTLAPGAEVELWHGDAGTLTNWYCLQRGRHSAVLGYRFPDGSLIFSDTFILETVSARPPED